MTHAIQEDGIQLSNTGKVVEIGEKVEQVPVSATLEEIKEAFDRDGVVCLADAFAPETIEAVLVELNSLMSSTHMEHFLNDEIKGHIGRPDKTPIRNSRDGTRANHAACRATTSDGTHRAYLTKHGTSVLLHQIIALGIHPGEVGQPIHRDNGFLWPIPGRCIPMGVVLMVPLADFTREAGSTRVILGSHL